MTIVIPSAAHAIVAPTTGKMAQHFREFVASLVANPMAAEGASFINDRIPRDRSLIRITFDLVPSADNVPLHLLGRVNGADVTANSWSRLYNDSGTTAASLTDTSDAQIILAVAVQSDAQTGGVSGEVLIHNIQSSRYKRASGTVVHFDGARERVNDIACRIDTASPITGVKLAFDGADIASGFVRVDAP
jgi:hypothetical protein